MYSIKLSKDALRQLTKLPLDIQERIVKGLERCRIRPSHFLERLVGSPYHKLRIGKYRVIMKVQNKELIITVIEIGHRKNIYKK